MMNQSIYYIILMVYITKLVYLLVGNEVSANILALSSTIPMAVLVPPMSIPADTFCIFLRCFVLINAVKVRKKN